MKKIMNVDFDIIIIGSGPAAVSAAFPLINKKISGCMLEGGENHKNKYPRYDFLKSRKDNQSSFTSLSVHFSSYSFLNCL